jgi:dihydroorotase-like cyclic amidohydrolase
MAVNPRRIYKLPLQPDTRVEVYPQARYTLSNEGLQTKCGWSPFLGMHLTGRVRRVVLHGQEVYVDGKVTAPPGSGQVFPYGVI